MIGRLKGIVDAIGESHAIIDVNGVGYEVQLTTRALRNIKIGDTVSLTIDTHVREDAIRLFGFMSEVERSWFRTLQTVQGVGAKVALGVLGVLSPHELASAIALQNWGAVEQAQGVGKKLAQRIVAELKDKTPAMPLGVSADGAPADGAASTASNEGLAAAEAVSALTNLGYNPGQASAAVSAALMELGAQASTAQLIRRGLKELAR
jgi:holliday junction DNA helicase RuvA